MNKIAFFFILFITSFSLFSQPYQMQWQSCFGGTEKDDAWDIISTENGYLIAGATSSSDGDISYNHGTTDCWLLQINNSGGLVWERTYGGSWGDGIFRIFPADGKNYYLLCAANSSDGDVSFDPYPETADFWVVKIDSIGGIIWEKIVGGNGDDQLWTGTATSDGGIVAYGWSGSTDGDVSINYGAYDIWMVKLNSAGEKEWDFTIGTDWFDYGQAIIHTSDGGFLCGGASAIGEGGNLTCDPFNYNAEAILVKLDKGRNIEWQQCYGGSDHDGITALIETTDGYVFGAYVNSNDGDITGWHGGNDIWIVKTDLLGNIEWQNPLGGSYSEFTSKLMVDDNGNIIVFGITESNDGDVIGNHSVSEHDNDIWIIKISSEGELLSQQCIGGGGDERMDFGVVKKSDYDFVIAGQTDYGPSFDVQCTPHSTLGIPDFWVFEIKDTLTSIQTKPSVGGEVKVYPNPAREYVSFQYDSQEFNNKARVEIFNSYGEKLENLVFYESTEQIIWDCRNTRPGIYFYIFTTNGCVKSGKIIIN